MCKNISFSRIVMNILFFVFYVLLISIIVSFVFPATLSMFGKTVLNPADPVFDKLQIAIIIFVFVFGFIFRRHFYLPIAVSKDTSTNKKVVKEVKEEKSKDSGGLDIKTGREVK